MCVGVGMCVYVLQKDRKNERKIGGGGGGMTQEASKATAEQGSEHCIRPMFIS